MYSISKCKALYKFLDKSIGFFMFFFSLSCFSATPEQILAIQTAAEQHVNSIIDLPEQGELVAKAAQLDSRIKASDCSQPLVASSSTKSHTTSSVTVLVECDAENWRVYVPVKTSISLPLVTVNRSLSRGDIISAGDLSMSMIKLTGYRRQGLTDIKQAVGAKLKKNVRLGKVLERNDICVVCRNEKVIIKAVKGGMTITTKGTALTDGASGDQIRVKNDKSKRIIEGVVTGIAEITVYF